MLKNEPKTILALIIYENKRIVELTDKTNHRLCLGYLIAVKSC